MTLGAAEIKGITPGIDGLDPKDDFLARERAALGDDADLFTGPNDNAVLQQQATNGEQDLLGGDDDFGTPNVASGETQQFVSSFPALDTNNDVTLPALSE